jgi:hypothetical protein
MECVLRWDIKKQTSKGIGILGTVVAFSAADEEQGRIHWHWQIWVTEINLTLWNCFFPGDITKRNIARKNFCKQIDNVMTASHGSEISITHKCWNENNEFVYRHASITISRAGLMYCSSCMTQRIIHRHSRKSYVIFLTVDKPFLHLTLSTNLLNSAQSLALQETEHRITGQIL